jgi:uncharacterized protein with GYD domain
MKEFFSAHKKTLIRVGVSILAIVLTYGGYVMIGEMTADEAMKKASGEIVEEVQRGIQTEIVPSPEEISE